MPFSRVLYIEQDDFREQPPKKYFRLFPGNEVRLRYAYLIRCTDVVKDAATGEVVEVRCTYDPATRGGDAPDGRRVKSTIHWVSAAHAVEAEVRLYEHLFTAAVPGADKDDWKADLNPEVARAADRLPPRAEPRRRGCRAAAISSSGTGTSAWTPWTPRPAVRSGIARSRCATPGPRSRRRVSRPRVQRAHKNSQPDRETIMPKKEIINLGTAAPNPNLSPATRFGNLVFVAGQTGRHPVTGEVGKDIREQTRNVLERIKLILAAAGTSLDNVLTATTYVTRREDVPAYNEEYAKYFPTTKPARTTVTVASLNSPELVIEITVTACIPD